jgi:hypothetical protein
MKYLLQLEELAQFIIVVFAFYYQPIHLSWWLWPIVFLTPDLGMVGYLANPAVGAITYNLTHHKMVAIILILLGYFINNNSIILAGLVIYGHSSFDRMLGYGLKYPDAFKHTHLGWM